MNIFNLAKTKLKDLTDEQRQNIDSVLGDDNMTIEEMWEKVLQHTRYCTN